VYADLLVQNGTILTLDPARPVAESLAAASGRILAVGDRQILAELRGPGTVVVDLHGGTALPAFTDAHCHLNAYGLAMDEVDCSPAVAPTIDAIKACIAATALGTGPGVWVQARGYDDTDLRPSRHPTRWDLDEVAPDVPVILRRRCGHVCVTNSVGLRLAGITASGPEVPGGKIDRDKGGEPTGVLRERAQELVRDIIPPPSVETLKRAILRAAEAYLHQGFCAVHDTGGRRVEEFQAYRELAEEGRLPLRVVMMVRDPWLEHCIGAGIATGFGDEWIKVGPVKLFADGGIGPQTAAVSRPYRSDRANTGILHYQEEELTDLALRAARAGFAVAIHAIGDEAIRVAINALARAVDEAPPRLPHRIEHCVLPTAEDIARMRRLRIAASVQPVFLDVLGDSWLMHLDAELAARCYPLRSMAAAGLLLAAGSDCPVAPSDPRRGLWAMVARRTQAGRPVVSGEALDRETALRLYTETPPRLMGEQSWRGRLIPGMAADIVILSDDPLRVRPDDLLHLDVWAVIVGGKVRHQVSSPVLS
jgi:predicted amidohydrolase YtcJ